MTAESAPRLTLKFARALPTRHPELEPVSFPSYKSTWASGMDLYADVGTEGMAVLPGTVTAIPTGLKMEIPDGYEGQVRPRGGLAFKNRVTVINTPGTVDSDYRGEVMVGLINHGSATFYVHRGDRIAQLVICPVVFPLIEIVEESELTDTKRGSGAFGSTGINDTEPKR